MKLSFSFVRSDEVSLAFFHKVNLTWLGDMDSQAQILRITIDQLAKLVRQLAATKPDEMLRGITASIPANNAIGASKNVRLIPANAFRWALWIGAAGAGTVIVWFGNTAVDPGAGPSLQNSTVPTLFTYKDLGGAILKDVMASGSAAGTSIQWQEFLAPVPLN